MLPKILYPATVLFAGEKLPSPLGFPRGGNIQVTYLLWNSVMQISPLLIQEDATANALNEVLSRWILPDKGLLYNNHLKALGDPVFESEYGWQIEVPECIEFGKLVFDPDLPAFDYWRLRRIFKATGASLEKAPRLRLALLDFMAKLHVPKIRDLRDYYTNRVSNIRFCLKDLSESRTLGKDRFEFLDGLAASLLEEAQEAIGTREVVCRIHGDFRDDNILVSGGDTAAVIDFEQGLLCGDPVVDLWKFGTVKIGSPAEAELECYLGKMESSGYCPDQILLNPNLLQKRLRLIRFDTLCSVLILRYLIGWSFETVKGPDGQELRGTEYVYNFMKEVFGQKT